LARVLWKNHSTALAPVPKLGRGFRGFAGKIKTSADDRQLVQVRRWRACSIAIGQPFASNFRQMMASIIFPRAQA
jgi:hypothetical protein